MSVEINGQNYSYDYQDLIQDLKDELEHGDIQPSSIIYILREEHPKLKHIGYKPIIDYYLVNDIVMINGSLEDIYNKDEFTADEWVSMEKERLAEKRQYEKDKPFLELATITAVLTEMELWNSIV